MPVQQQMILESDPRARRVVDVPLAEEMSESFLAYGLSVITARAIPDVRDGLKPVQRRILWSMLQMGVRPGTPFRKSARIVGDTMGRYHPHGDAAIYDALVRLGQDFSRRVALVTPQGNFGSLDDPPAAARYTECRLSDAAMDMVAEVEEDTVDFRPTYDGEGAEPSVLPAALPNLLVNGTAGIAVGMATNMAPHNLGEIAAAMELVLRGRERLLAQRTKGDGSALLRPARADSLDSGGAAGSGSGSAVAAGESGHRDLPGGTAGSGPCSTGVTTDELLKVVPGPDFPGGGRVVDQGMRQMYESGRGPIRVQARVHVERVTRSREAIIVTELPYLVGSERLVARITKLVEAGRLSDVAGIADLTDTGGLCIRINLKPGVDAQSVLAVLHRLTPLEETFHVNNVVLVDGVPTTLGLRALCEHYIEHRLDVIVRRTRYRRRKASRRLELVDGLLVALSDIDSVVQLIRRSQNPADARGSLMSVFGLTERQAVCILDMPLRRLTALERQKLVEEAESLRAAIEDYERILASDSRRHRIVRDELRRIVKDHGTPRRSEMVSQFEADQVSECSAVAGQSGDLARASATLGADRGGAGDGVGGNAAGARNLSQRGAHSELKQGRDIACVVTVSTSGNLGRAALSGARRASPGRHDLLAARVTTSTAARLALVTSDGRVFVVSAVEASDASNRLRGSPVAPMLGLAKTERVLTLVTAEHHSTVLVTARGMTRRISAESVLSAEYGSQLINLEPGDRVVSAFPADDDLHLVIVADDAKALRTPAAGLSLRSTARGAVGMRLNGGVSVVGAGVVAVDGAPDADGIPAGDGACVVISTTAGGLKATSCSELATQSRGGRGVLVAKLVASEKVSAVAVVPGLIAVPSGGSGSDYASLSGSIALWPENARLMAMKARDGNPRSMDPHPVPVRVELTKRYAAPRRTGGRRILLMAPARW